MTLKESDRQLIGKRLPTSCDGIGDVTVQVVTTDEELVDVPVADSVPLPPKHPQEQSPSGTSKSVASRSSWKSVLRGIVDRCKLSMFQHRL
jgi:hypothetical protein